MISNEELVAKVQETKTRPNCFTLALIGATNPTAKNPTPTAAANAAERHGLSKEDIQHARWIAMYLKRGLGDGLALLHEFFESEQQRKTDPQEEKAMEDTATKEKELVDRELLDVALGLRGTMRDRDALAIAVILEKTLRELKSKMDAGQLELPDPLPKFKLHFKDQTSSPKGVRVVLENPWDLCVSVGTFTDRGSGSTCFHISKIGKLDSVFLKNYQWEISRYLKVAVEEYTRTVEFVRSAIIMIPYLLSQKRIVQ